MNSLSFRSTFSLVFAAAVVSGLGDGLIPIAFALQAHRVDPSGRGLTVVLIAQGFLSLADELVLLVLEITHDFLLTLYVSHVGHPAYTRNGNRLPGH